MLDGCKTCVPLIGAGVFTAAWENSWAEACGAPVVNSPAIAISDSADGKYAHEMRKVESFIGASRDKVEN